MTMPVRGFLPLALFFAAQLPAQDRKPLPAEFDAYVEKVRQTFTIPGLSIAVVKDGEVVLARGYGVQALGKDATVDARTNFGIASNSKVFTALALGLLVEQGKLTWNAPVQQYLPAFHLADPYVSRELTVLDLLVHRSGLGLGAGDLLWWPGTDYDRKEIVRRLRHVPLETSFRSTYAYDNVLYLVAGELIEVLSGQSWEAFVAERILKPVGMKHSCVRHHDAEKQGNLAGTHARVGETVQAVTPDTSDATNPAGGIRSNAEDMGKWLVALLSRGALPDGGRLCSEATWRKLTTLVTPIPIKDPHPTLGALRPNFSGYALGLGVSDYRGHKTIMHTGGLPGYVSRVLWVPDLRFGIAVLTNQESLHGIDAIVYRVLDHQHGASDPDWLAIHDRLETKARAEARDAQNRAASARQAESKPALPIAAYAGTYRDAWYGDVVITYSGDAVRIRFAHTPLLQGRLEHWQHDTFLARWDDRGLRADAFVTFTLDSKGAIDQVRMAPASPDVDFSYDYQHLLLRPVARQGRAGQSGNK